MSYHYETIEDIVRLSKEKNGSFADVVLHYEMEQFESTQDSIYQEIDRRLSIFEESIQAGLINTGKTPSAMSGGQGACLHINGPRLLGPTSYKALTYSIAVNEANAKMFRIIACPTAGSCGVLPGCMKALEETFGSSLQVKREAFLVASGIGKVITERACVAGAVGGCQAEVGTAAAMAAGAVVSMMGGTAEQIANALALSLKNVLGLVCDPVAGLVEVPCVKRNGFFAVQALVAAELSLAGIETQIPADEVIEAMNVVGGSLPASLRETSEGGLAQTPTGQAIALGLRNL